MDRSRRTTILITLIMSMALLAAVLLPAPAAAQGTLGKISGRVTDAKTREALIGVNVMVQGTNRGAATDAHGDYFIANLTPGTCILRARQVGYNDVVVTGVRVLVDATTPVDIAMDQTVLDIGQEVVVTAKRPPVQNDNTATRVFMESSEIMNRPATAVSELVTTLPSINFEGGGLRVRGGGMNEVAFLVDGVRARNPMNQEAYTNLNLSSIQEMEVITGSYNAEYGEARSGVFNVVTKEGSERYQAYLDFRYTPPGVKHWGPSIYDENTPTFWENTHARHQQWWIDHPDQWVDPLGKYGNDPLCSWTPEQAYQEYMGSHSPLTEYDKIAGYDIEASLGGPIPGVNTLRFFLSGKYRSYAPLMGNAYTKRGTFFDGTAKLTYALDQNTKLTLSGFLGVEKTSWGVDWGGVSDWGLRYAIDSRYAYYDYDLLPTTSTDGENLKITRIVDAGTMWEVKLSRVFAHRERWPFPDDPLGWDASGPTRDNLRAYEYYTDTSGTTYVRDAYGGNQNRIGYHTLGYYYRYDSKNTDWTATAFYSSQVNKFWQLKAGAEFTYYMLDQYNQAKSPDRLDVNTYHPFQGAVYEQNKLETLGFIMNLGIRLDLYSPNDLVYSDLFDPLNGPTQASSIFAQVSPRLGISHPIDENTVLHFSYGHFFERGPFGDYGEGTTDEEALGSLTTLIVTGTTSPWVLGNRNTKPEKTVAYELGIERNFFDEFILGVTAFYKDIRNTLRVVTVEAPVGVYRTNGNGNYADVRGFELSLRKQPTRHSWGMMSGYANFTTQIGIYGRSGDPSSISPTRVTYGTSGDDIQYNNPRLKAGLYYETPELGIFAGLLDHLSISVDYFASFANEKLLGDSFEYGGQRYLRPPDQNTNLRVRKDITLPGGWLRLGLYAEIRNLFNNQWLNFEAFRQASMEDQAKFATSGFEYIPSYTATGAPILEFAKYRNLPRQYLFGVTLEL
jgi:outer membrane receptor protein involved in Fe transport